jgi:hypothetical protein
MPFTALPSGCPFVPALQRDIPGRSVLQARGACTPEDCAPFQVLPGRNPLLPENPVTQSLKERFRFLRLTEHPGLVWDRAP